MKEKNMLSEDEKKEICSYIKAGKFLPPHFLPRLLDHNAGQRNFRENTEQHTRAVEGQNFTLREFVPAQDESAPIKGQWHNMIFCCENHILLRTLLCAGWREEIERQGGIKLIYIDPPFSTGKNFKMKAAGDTGDEKDITAYSDKWSDESFLDMIYQRLILMHQLLAEDGCIYVHCDWRSNAYLRIMLDEIFGHHINEIIWHYTGGGRSGAFFSRKHDTIFVYARSGKFTFNSDAIRVPYNPASGYAKNGIISRAGKKYLPNPGGTIPDDVWDIPIINPLSRERTGYPTQKPEALLTRILLASTRENDLVADFFCGSGTLAATAEKLGRKWITADKSKLAIHTTRKRLLNMDRRMPFAILAESGHNFLEECAHLAENIEFRLHIKDARVTVLLINDNRKTAPSGMDWKQLIDYWAVDFSYGKSAEYPETFTCDWCVFRTKGLMEVPLASPPRRLEKGSGRIAVKIVDIYGHEILKVLELPHGHAQNV